MSYPGYHGPDFLEQISKGLQVRAMVEDIRARREARAQQAELHRLAIESHQQNNALKNFQTTMMLQDIGALPVAPGTAGKFEAGMGGRSTINAPGGQQYSLPTAAQKYQRAQIEAQQKGTLAGIAQNATTAVTEPNEDIAIPDELGGGTESVPKTKGLDYRLKIEETLQKRNPNLQISYSDDKQGNRTYFGANQKTGEVKPLGTFGGVAKPQAAGAEKERLPSNAEIEELMGKWRQNLYNSRGITPEVLHEATGPGTAGRDMIGNPTGARSNPSATRVREAEKELRDAATAEVKSRIRNEQVTKGTQPTASIPRRTGFDPGAARGVPIQSRTTKGANSAPKVGEERTVRGKKMKITKVYADGSFDAK